MGLMTVLGVRKLGFFIPYRYAGQILPIEQRPPYDAIEALFRARENVFQDVLAQMQELAPDLLAIGDEKPPQPRWRQDWFSRLDAMAAYTMVRRLKPKRIVEVGSGHSTRFLARAARDGVLDISITAIDPAPRADISKLNVFMVRETVQGAGLKPFAELADGDILSIDSSHILMPASDVDFLFNIIMPSLAPGVIVHIHDMFLPDDYPPSWAWRGYNEQLAVATLLQGQGYDMLWSSRYVVTRMVDALNAMLLIEKIECPKGAFESSLWLRKASRT